MDDIWEAYVRKCRWNQGVPAFLLDILSRLASALGKRAETAIFKEKEAF